MADSNPNRSAGPGTQRLSVLPDEKPSSRTLLTRVDGTEPGGPLSRHPCYAPQAQGRQGRIHLPVSPQCNIFCRFCDRKFNATENRPGVARARLQPWDAPAIVSRALELCPELSVVGVAGPGDPLSSPHALEALELVHANHPDLIGCLSTNGLCLTENVDRIVRAGIRSVTVTVNALDPEILVQLCAGIIHQGRTVTGLPAAQILIEAQMAGIQAAARSGLTVKVNSVLVPTVNDRHIPEIARVVRSLGASLMNVIALIPQGQLAHLPAPDCALVDRVRAEVDRHLPAFRHCQRCRADACGVPGSGVDFGEALFGKGDETFSHG